VAIATVVSAAAAPMTKRFIVFCSPLWTQTSDRRQSAFGLAYRKATALSPRDSVVALRKASPNALWRQSLV
jgi:hypothetical protein